MKTRREFSVTRAPRILLIDDDPLFGKTLTRVAHSANIPLVYTTTPRAVDATKIRALFDVIITDYDLQNVTGIQIIQRLEIFNQALPTILVSSYLGFRVPNLPASILFTIHKCEGPQRILHAALCAHSGLTRR
jgi:CheY-like chemotaxis protein